eukprot:TRINITY_DN4715_c0_g4_i1.p1 TRINITY_DN4715_c0_g4~~TRINITY_DN4715_c0_g4_i1.p1  ORF type:complete len:193 (+),score=21.24 TRINITY_DN4715_c0_g4_i1:267-845(+)
MLNWINVNNLKIIPNKKGSHKWTYQKGTHKSRIDQIITSQSVSTSKIWTFQDSPGPDHFPISIQLHGYPNAFYPRNHPKFHFNAASRKAYQEAIHPLLEQTGNFIEKIVQVAKVTSTKSSGILISQIKWVTRAKRTTQKMISKNKIQLDANRKAIFNTPGSISHLIEPCPNSKRSTSTFGKNSKKSARRRTE